MKDLAVINRLTTTLPNQPWLRWLVVFAVLLLSAALAYRSSARLDQLILLALPALAAAIFLLRYPQVGLLAVVVVSLIIPYALGTGTTVSIPAGFLLWMLLIGLWFFDMLVIRRNVKIISSPVLLPSITVLVVALLAFLDGQLPWVTAVTQAPLNSQLGGLLVFLLSVGALFLVAHKLNNLDWLKWLTYLFLGLGGIYLLGRVVPVLSFIIRPYSSGSTGSVFWIFLVSLSLSQALINPRLKTYWRVVLILIASSALYVGVVMVRPWTSGWLPPLLALAVVLLLWKPRWGFPILFLAGVLIILNWESIYNQIVIGDNEYSVISRWDAWRIVVEIGKINPLFGLGPSNYHFYTVLYPILGYYVQFNSHNQYVDLFAQTGLLGLLAYLWLFVTLFWIGWRLKDRLSPGFARAYVVGCLGAIVGLLFTGMLGDWVIPFVYNIGIPGTRASLLGWMFLGGLVTIEQMVKNGTLPMSENISA